MDGLKDQWLAGAQMSALSYDHRLISYPTKDLAIAALVEDIALSLNKAINAKGSAVITGCGGQTPKPLYGRLAEAPLLWGQVAMIILDERHVPAFDERSNFGMMKAVFASKPAAAAQIYGLNLDEHSLTNSAILASQSIKPIVLAGIDYALMGMGNDAHFASIFPYHKNCSQQWQDQDQVISVPRSDKEGQEPVIDRLSLSPKTIVSIKKKVFFITGDAKREVLLRAQTDSDPISSPLGALMRESIDLIDFVWCP